MPVLNAKIYESLTHTQSYQITQFAFCNLSTGLCFVFATAVEALHKTHSTVFISLLKTRMFQQQLTDESGQTGRKRNSGLLCLHFLLSSFSALSTWLIQRHVSEREYNRALWSFIFLEMLVSSFCVQASSNSNGRHGRSGLCPHFPSEEPFDLVLALGLAEFPCSVAPLEAVPAGHLECWIRSPCISAVISHVQLFVTP